MKPLRECRLYGFVDTAYLRGRRPAFVASQLCSGGVDLIQLRAKGSSLAEVKALAAEVASVTKPAGVGLVINDHLSVALDVGAEICHLGQEDFFDAGFTHVSQLRPPGSSLLIGLSTHAPQQASRAITAGADYIAIGPIFATGTKPTAVPVSLEYVSWASKNVQLPWFAIGGINLQNLRDVLDAGAERVCVVSAILNSNEIAATTAEFKRLLEEKE